MSTWDDALAARAALAAKITAGTARLATPFVCEATTFGGPHDPGTGSSGYKGEDLRRWAPPEPFAIAELSTNYTAPTASLDYRALIMLVPLDQRRLIMGQRVTGDPTTGLPHRWPFRVTLNTGGRAYSVVGAKLDRGRGGAPTAPAVPRAADLFWLVAAWLGVENARTPGWAGIVTIEVALP